MATYTLIVQPDGKLPVGIRETLARVIPSFAGKKIQLSIGEAKDKRSLDQNSYYWGPIIKHVRHVRFDMGDPLTEAQIHEDLLDQFAPRVEAKRIDGTAYTRPKRSKEMNVEEMANYITAITATMAQFGYPVPAREAQ